MSGIDGSIRISDDDLLSIATYTTTTEWDRFWDALGIVVRCVALRRAGLREAALKTIERPVAAQTEPSKTQPKNEPAVEPVSVKPPSEAERLAASRARGAAAGGFVKGGTPGKPGAKHGAGGANGPRTCSGCGREFPRGMGKHRATCPALKAAAAAAPAPVLAPVAPVAFADRAKAAAARTWAENHPDELPA